MGQTLSLKLNEQLDREVLKGEIFMSIWSWECRGFKVNIRSLKHFQGVGVGPPPFFRRNIHGYYKVASNYIRNVWFTCWIIEFIFLGLVKLFSTCWFSKI